MRPRQLTSGGPTNLPTHSISSVFIDRDLLTNPQKGNNTFAYNFGRTIWTSSDTKVSLSNFSVPFSWYNISKALQNNLIGYTWFDGNTYTTPGTYGGIQEPIFPAAPDYWGRFFPLTIPDGYYDIPALNAFLQFSMIQNGHYMIDNNNNYVYFLELVENPTSYRVQVNSYQLPNNGVPSGWSAGPSTNVAITGAYPTPQLMLFPQNNISNLFTLTGFTQINLVPGWTAPSGSIVINAGTPSAFPAMGSHVGIGSPSPPLQYNIQAAYPKLISQVHSICLTCSYVDNPLRSTQEHAVSTQVLTTQSITVPYGQLIQNTNFFTTWIPLLQDQKFEKLIFQLTDQEGNPLELQDQDTNIELLITNLRY
jgi:hypothetical protein